MNLPPAKRAAALLRYYGLESLDPSETDSEAKRAALASLRLLLEEFKLIAQSEHEKLQKVMNDIEGSFGAVHDAALVSFDALNAATETAVIASISTPVFELMLVSPTISISFVSLILIFKSHLFKPIGWHSGMSSLVFLEPIIPAIIAV